MLGTITRSLLDNGAAVEAASSSTPITSVVISTPGAGALALLLAATGSLLARRRLA